MSTAGGHGGSSGQAGHGGQGQSLMPGDFSNADILGSDFEAFSWSHLTSGLKVNSGVRFAIIFMAFMGWLFVVYWIRHHEPLTNQVLGIAVPQSSTAAADRALISDVKKVLPFQIPTTVRSFYAPTPQQSSSNILPVINAPNYNRPLSASNMLDTPTHFTAKPSVIQASAPGQAISAPLSDFCTQEYDQRFGSPVSH